MNEWGADRLRVRGREKGGALEAILTYMIMICYEIRMLYLFDHEKLDVYAVELEFVGWIALLSMIFLSLQFR